MHSFNIIVKKILMSWDVFAQNHPTGGRSNRTAADILCGDGSFVMEHLIKSGDLRDCRKFHDYHQNTKYLISFSLVS